MVTWRACGADEAAEIDAWLVAHGRGPVCALANLREFGMVAAGGEEPFAIRFWRAKGGEGLIGLTRNGVMLPQLGEVTDFAHLRAALRGQEVAGAIGTTDCVARICAALLPEDTPRLRDETEPAFRLSLADLIIPPHEGLHLAPIRGEDVDFVIRWLIDYDIELCLNTPEEARAEAPWTIAQWRAADSHRLLWRGDTPVAMTGFNARLEDLVQVGAVYCPPGLRRHGYARAAVALHLAEARGQGIAQARLWAASDNAARAYRAIGFVPDGAVRMVRLMAPVTL